MHQIKFRVGDRVAYPTRQSSSTSQNLGTVVEIKEVAARGGSYVIDKDGKRHWQNADYMKQVLKIKKAEVDKIVTVTEVHRVVRLCPLTYHF
jgi:hypothetical protein